MPTYEYQCNSCNHRFDEFQSMSEAPLTRCPRCKKKKKLRRLFGTGAAILFKGSGFYQTDYRSEAYRAAAQADEARAGSAADAGNGTTSTNGTAAAASQKSAGETGKSKPEKAKSSP